LSGSPTPTRRSSLGSTEVFVVVEAQVVENFDRFKQEIHKEKNQEMLDFRKTFLTFAAVGLVFAGTASAQVATLASLTPVNGSGFAAVEGVTESLPVIQVAFTTPNTGVSSATLVLTSNVPFTMGTVTSTGKLDVTAAINAVGGTAATSVTLTGPTTLTVVFSGLSGTDQTISNIFISNLRVNASLAPSSSQITLSATGVAGGGITGSLAAVPVAFVVASEVAPVLAGAPNQSLCTISSKTVYPVVTTTIQENFPSAFKTGAEVTNGSAIAASQGTVLAVTFTNLVPGVSYYVPSSVTGTGSLILTAYTGATGATPATATAVGSPSVPGLVLLTPTGTSATAYYGVTSANGALSKAPRSLCLKTFPRLHW